jgi:hypothetical protein
MLYQMSYSRVRVGTARLDALTKLCRRNRRDDSGFLVGTRLLQGRSDRDALQFTDFERARNNYFLILF